VCEWYGFCNPPIALTRSFMVCLFNLCNSTDEYVSWPPQDTASAIDSQDTDHSFSNRSTTPWTYGNGILNPNLEPSNTQRRNAAKRHLSHGNAGVSPYPPYHPDYIEDAEIDDHGSSSDDAYQPLVRQGSEGYEARPVDRENLLQRYLSELGETPGRYHRYVPDAGYESDGEDDRAVRE